MCRSRKGLSLLEALVVIAILAVLVGLVLTGVQTARLAAHRADASNRFRQLMIASVHFASNHDGLLPDTWAGPPAHGYAPLEALGPYLEVPPAASPLPPAFTKLPSDPTRSLRSEKSEMPWPQLPIDTEEVGPTSFAFNAYIFAQGVRTPVSITDGTSNTIGITEHYSFCGKTTFLYSMTQQYCLSGNPPSTSPCVLSTTHRATFADKVYDDVRPLPPPNEPTRTFQTRPTPADCDYRVPQSSVPGVLLVGFLDGSVRAVRPAVSPAVFWGTVTPNGGEVGTID